MMIFSTVFSRILRTKLLTTLCCSSALALFFSHAVYSSDLKLPNLGDVSEGIISPAQEYELGQSWLRMYRAQVPTSRDPFLQTYVEETVRKLAAYSDLEDKRIEVLVVENPYINAFAVPGGIIGVHTGLFSYAETDQQFASVIAHELAHLSQHHFARRISQQKHDSIPNMAAMLASILVAVTAGGDAGVAAIATTQAIAADKQLRFSRKMEQEADRIGMSTMVKAQLDPNAMPQMFERMLKASRFQRHPPEFLITHPLTESRITDSKLRAQKYPAKPETFNLEYALLKIRADSIHANDYYHQEKTYAAILEKSDKNTPSMEIKQRAKATRYGLALAQLQQGKGAQAEKTLAPLIANEPKNIYFQVLQAQIEAEQQRFDTAIERLNKQLKKAPGHHALNIAQAEIMMKAGAYAPCEALLQAHVKRKPNDEYVWYLLAEVHGLTGNILKVHQARAEYFILNGLFSKAENQLQNALKLARDDRILTIKLEQRLKEVRKLQRSTLS